MSLTTLRTQKWNRDGKPHAPTQAPVRNNLWVGGLFFYYSPRFNCRRGMVVAERLEVLARGPRLACIMTSVRLVGLSRLGVHELVYFWG